MDPDTVPSGALNKYRYSSLMVGLKNRKIIQARISNVW